MKQTATEKRMETKIENHDLIVSAHDLTWEEFVSNVLRVDNINIKGVKVLLKDGLLTISEMSVGTQKLLSPVSSSLEVSEKVIEAEAKDYRVMVCNADETELYLEKAFASGMKKAIQLLNHERK